MIKNRTKILKQLLFFSILILLIGCTHPNPTEGNAGDNNPPEINNIFMDPVFIRVGTTATIRVDATDPDGDVLSYSWSAALGDIIGSGNEVRYTAAYCCVGINTINITVTDSRGASVSESINIEVNP